MTTVDNQQLEWIEDLTEQFGDAYDTSYMPIMYAGWSTHEEYAEVYVLQRDNTYYLLELGHNVFGHSAHAWNPQPVSQDQALDAVLFMLDLDSDT